MKIEREVEFPGPIFVRWSVYERLMILAEQKHTTVQALAADLIDEHALGLAGPSDTESKDGK